MEADEDSEAGHAAAAVAVVAAVVGRAADGGDGSCRDPWLNTGREDSWKDSLENEFDMKELCN